MLHTTPRHSYIVMQNEVETMQMLMSRCAVTLLSDSRLMYE